MIIGFYHAHPIHYSQQNNSVNRVIRENVYAFMSSRISNGTAVLMRKDVRYCVRQRNNLFTKPTELLGIERKFNVFTLIRKRGSVFNR